MKQNRQRIFINFHGGSVAVDALVFGDYAVHQAVTSNGFIDGVYSITILHNGTKISDYTSHQVAVNFAKEMDRKYDLSPITDAMINGMPLTPEMESVLDEIRQRRLHVTYVPQDALPATYIADAIKNFREDVARRGMQS